MPDVAALPMPYRKENFMTDNDATPLFFPDTVFGTAHLMRVKPRNKHLIDPITHDSIFQSLWEVDTCMGDDVWLPLTEVRDRMLPFHEWPNALGARLLLADATIRQVLAHPQTPYGLGIHGGPDSAHLDLVFWRSGTYRRSEAGVLTRVKGQPRHDLWPDASTWRKAQWAARLLARRQGLLR